MKLKYAGLTDVGRKRDHNEDNYLILGEQHLFVVADGMGGHNAGEVASQMAVDALKDFFQVTSKDEDATWPYKPEKKLSYSENRLVAGIKLANRNIFEESLSNSKRKGMGTTIVSMVWDEEKIVVGHAGDSRCYRIRGSEIHQITEDHSFLNQIKKELGLTPQEEADFRHKNVILRALGIANNVEVEINHVLPEKNDIYLICSDGLSGEITDPDIAKIVSKHADDLEAGAKELIQTACDNGGSDNITAILVKYLGS